jgi:hypothetical protein
MAPGAPGLSGHRTPAQDFRRPVTRNPPVRPLRTAQLVRGWDGAAIPKEDQITMPPTTHVAGQGRRIRLKTSPRSTASCAARHIGR